MSIETRMGVSQRPRGVRGRVIRWLAVPALVIGGSMIGDGLAGARNVVVPTETRETVDVLRLRCAGSDGEVASVRCQWTAPEGATGVKVLRATVGHSAGRQTVFRTDDVSVTRFVDSPVRRGVRYIYVVRAVDADGRLVAASRPAVAGVPATPDPAVDVLRLDCGATSATTARCRWSAPTSPARVLTLWRSVDGGARERVASFANPFPTSYGDVVPTATSRAVYAVIATDGAGEIVSRSRAAGVAFPPRTIDHRPDDVRPVNPSVDAVDLEPTSSVAQPPTTPSETAPAATVSVATEPPTAALATTTTTERPPANDQRPAPVSSVPAERPVDVAPTASTPSAPVTAVPADETRPADAARPSGDDGQPVEHSGGDRTDSRAESSGREPSGESDRAG